MGPLPIRALRGQVGGFATGSDAAHAMRDTSEGGRTIRAWYSIAVAALLLPILTLCLGAWLERAWQHAPSEAGGWRELALPLAVAIAATVSVGVSSIAGVRLARGINAIRIALQVEQRRCEATEEALRRAQKMAAVGRLAGGIAHDFNNQLTVISSNVELLQRRLPNDPPMLRRLSGSAMQGVRQAATLTQRLLAFARQDAPDPEPLDANRVVAGMLDLLRRTLGERIEIDTVSARGLWLTRIDASQLEAALLNLAVNARDAMPRGGRLTIETGNVVLDQSDQEPADLAPGQYVMVAVRAARAGVPGPVFAGASDAFGATRTAGESGVGLSMVHSFASQSGGQVRIDNTADRGPTIRLYLPRHVPSESPLAAISEPLHRSGAATAVLVVEDDDSVRNAVAGALGEIGYEVLEAPDAMEAVRLLADRGGIDLLFTDLGLPGGVNGRALADAARNIHPDLKVLFTTGYQREAIVGAGLSPETEHFLPKPFSLQQLEAKVREVLDAPLTVEAVSAPTAPATVLTATVVSTPTAPAA